MKALIVDDSRAIRNIIAQMLVDLGVETVTAAHGREGLEMLLTSTKPFDVVLIDWNMPEMNGYELVCAIRKDARFNDVRLVMVTTETEMAQMVKVLQAGANEYIMKPFTKEVLLEKLTLMGLLDTSNG